MLRLLWVLELLLMVGQLEEVGQLQLWLEVMGQLKVVNPLPVVGQQQLCEEFQRWVEGLPKVTGLLLSLCQTSSCAGYLFLLRKTLIGAGKTSESRKSSVSRLWPFTVTVNEA